MTAFVDLAPEVLPEAPQADMILLERSVRRAVREFCEKTLVLEATTTPYLNVVANEAEYTLPAVAERDIVRVKRKGVWWGADRQLIEKSEDQLDNEQGNPTAYLIADSQNTLASTSIVGLNDPWRAMKDAEPVVFYQPRPERIRLVPIPNTAYAQKLGVTYHLKPSIRSTEVDDFVIAQWQNFIVFGTLAELLQIKNKPWTDLRLAADYRQRFLAGMDDVVANRVSGWASNDYTVGHVRAWP